MATPAGFENKVAFIWKIADKLRGPLKPHEYGSVMLPTRSLSLSRLRPRSRPRPTTRST